MSVKAVFSPDKNDSGFIPPDDTSLDKSANKSDNIYPTQQPIDSIYQY